MKTMKALELKGIHDLELKDLSIPKPGLNDVLIKVKVAAICHTDFATIDGECSMISYPCVPGHEFSGIIEEIGNLVTHLKVGDRVTALGFSYCGTCRICRRGIHAGCTSVRVIPFHYDGAFAQYLVAPSITVYPISSNLSFENAAMVEPAANGYSIVDRAKIYPGENVLVIGPGPIGLFATQFSALMQPSKLIVNGTRNERLSLAKDLGATDTINIRREDPLKKIMEITEGYGVDVVLYCGGGQEVWDLTEKILAPFGRFIIEAVTPKVDDRFQVTPFKFLEKSMTYSGVSGYNAAQFEVALGLIESGKIDTNKVITHRFALNNYRKAFETSKKRKEGAIKVIFNSF